MPSTPKLIAFSGLIGVGKSKAAQMLSEHRGFQRVYFAQGFKAMIDTLLNLTLPDGVTPYGEHNRPPKHETIDALCGRTLRYAYQTIGTEWGRSLIGADLWCNVGQAQINRHHAAGHSVVVDDLRFPNEAQMIKSHGGIIVEITRPGVERQGHISEAGFDPDLVDFRYDNDRGVAQMYEWLALTLPL